MVTHIIYHFTANFKPSSHVAAAKPVKRPRCDLFEGLSYATIYEKKNHPEWGGFSFAKEQYNGAEM